MRDGGHRPYPGHMATTQRIAATAAVLVLLATGCGSSEEPEPVEPQPATTAPTDTPEPEAEPTTDPAEPGAARETPAAVGETVTWGDYELSLGPTNYDATEWALQAYADEWHGGDLTQVEPLADGMVYISAPITLTYVGDDVGEPSMDITVSYVTADGNVHDTPNSHPAPQDLRDVNELYPDASAEANIMLEVPADAAEGGVWRLYDTFAEQRVEVFFASQ